MCPTTSLTEVAGRHASDVQKGLWDYLAGEGDGDAAVFARASACLTCFGCVSDVCPEGLDPMAANQAVLARHLEPEPDQARDQRTVPAGAPTVVFTGCNIHKQPDMVADLVHVLGHAIKGPWALLPGGAFCCGNDRLVQGQVAEAAVKLDDLVETLAGMGAQRVLLWCPACLAVFQTLFEAVQTPAFRVQTVTGYVAEHLDRLAWTGRLDEDVTLHQPCRYANLNLDGAATRNILAAIPGVQIVEMKHQGEAAPCCGNIALKRGFEAGQTIRDARMAEARSSGAATLATVCHRCHQVLSEGQEPDGPAVRTLLSMVCEALNP